MRIDIDLDENDRIVSGPGVKDAVRLLQFKRDTSASLVLRFWSAGIQVELPADAVGTFGIKPKGQYDGTALVLAESWVKTGTGATTVYTFAPAFNGDALADLFGSGDDNVSNDEATFLGMCEIKWIADGKKHRTQTVDALIDNDVLKDGDGGPPSSSLLWAPPLALTAPPVNELKQVLELQFNSTVPVASGYITVTLVSADVNSGTPLVFTAAVTLGMDFAAMYAAIYAAIGAQSLIAAAFTLDIIDGIHLTRKARGNDASLALTVTDPDTILSDPGPLVSTISTAGIEGTTATALGQLAIVSTSNASGDFEDVWINSNLSPMTYQPPGQITRAPDGTLYRAIVDNAGIPSTELAYP